MLQFCHTRKHSYSVLFYKRINTKMNFDSNKTVNKYWLAMPLMICLLAIQTEIIHGKMATDNTDHSNSNNLDPYSLDSQQGTPESKLPFHRHSFAVDNKEEQQFYNRDRKQASKRLPTYMNKYGLDYGSGDIDRDTRQVEETSDKIKKGKSFSEYVTNICGKISKGLKNAAVRLA